MCEDLDDGLDIDLFNNEATSASTASSTPHSSLVMWLVFLIAQIQKKHVIPMQCCCESDTQITVGCIIYSWQTTS